jgi:transposase
LTRFWHEVEQNRRVAFREVSTNTRWHDRDINAAKNILAAGQAVTACGADVRHPGPPGCNLL